MGKIKSYIYKKGNKVSDSKAESIQKSLPHGLKREFEQILPKDIKKNQRGTQVYVLDLRDGMDKPLMITDDTKAIIDNGNFIFAVRKYYEKGKGPAISEISKQELNADYPFKNPEWVWKNWSADQRAHFLTDHQDLTGAVYASAKTKWEDLHKIVKAALEEHVRTGRYAEGDKISGEKMYEKFIKGAEEGTIEKIGIHSYGADITPYNTDRDSYTPAIKLIKTELLAIAIASFVKDGYTKERIQEVVEWLMETKK